MKLSISKVLSDDAERKKQVKPLPAFKLKGVVVTPASNQQPVATTEQPVTSNQQPATTTEQPATNTQIHELEQEMIRVKKQRAILSTQGVRLVESIEARLRADSGAEAAQEFLDGNLPMPELAAHYANVMQFTYQMQALHDRINRIKQYGAETEKADDVVDSNDARIIQYELRRLDDLIYKTGLKIRQSQGGVKKPKNSDRVNEWREKLSIAELRREDLKRKLKAMR